MNIYNELKQAILTEIEEQKRFRKAIKKAAKAFIGKTCSECKIPLGYDFNFGESDFLEFLQHTEKTWGKTD